MVKTEPINIQSIVSSFKTLQDDICKGIEALDGKSVFQEDAWKRPEGGGGRTRLIQAGQIFERGGVNFSHVHGNLPEKIAARLGFENGVKFHATGVSIVMHPTSPKIPIIHKNIRYFQMESGEYWFGGGIDLTPIYIVPEDASWFHLQLKKACDKHDATYYPRFKDWCDRYFFLKHRNETRGIGGIFFDKLSGESEEDKNKLFQFVMEVGETFLPAYTHIVRKHSQEPFTEAEKEFQYLRRSRYVEFNLLFDVGTKFGIDTDGRTESILMSMPPVAKWEYNYQPKPGSPEAFTLDNLKARDW